MINVTGGAIRGAMGHLVLTIKTPTAPPGHALLLYPVHFLWERPEGLLDVSFKKSNGKEVAWVQHNIEWDGSYCPIDFNAIELPAGFYFEVSWSRSLVHSSILLSWDYLVFDKLTEEHADLDWI